MQVTPTKNKPLNDKIIELPVHDLSLDFIKELIFFFKLRPNKMQAIKAVIVLANANPLYP